MFNLNKAVRAAQQRLERALDVAVSKHKHEIANPYSPDRCLTITIRDRTHFYEIVNWCNRNVGKGKQYWTIKNRVLRFVDPSKPTYNPPVTRNVWIFVPGIDISPLLKL